MHGIILPFPLHPSLWTQYKDGVLTITVPKRPEEAPKATKVAVEKA
jgi:HSP20 family molecular chaperone IbpA